MDDLILWISYDPSDHMSYQKALEIKQYVLGTNNVYTGGLELEEQKPIDSTHDTFKNKFSGTVITTSFNPITLSIAPHNKNEESMKEGKQKYPRFTQRRHTSLSTKK